MNILAIEASSDACSCALATGADLEERHEVAPRRHTERLLPMARDLLDCAGIGLGDLDRIAYGRGPGSFTGVRIAACVAQGLALAAGLSVVPVSSLAALAARGGTPGDAVLACLDARMGEVYLGAFRIDAEGFPQPVGPERLGSPEGVALPEEGDWTGIGSGWALHAKALGARLGRAPARVLPDLLPGAREVALLAARAGAGLAPADAAPGYLRREVASPRPVRVPGESSSPDPVAPD